jgi:hypothetical protein
MERLTVFRFDGGGDDAIAQWSAMDEEVGEIAREHGAELHIIGRDGDDIIVINLWRTAEGSEAMAQDPRVLESLAKQGYDGPPPNRTHYDVERVVVADPALATR